jgi:CheY-like chemotaxis protein
MTRVLVGDFAALQQLGYRDLLRAEGLEVLEAEGHDLVERLVEALPDVVVLDSDDESSPALVDRIVHHFPAVKVITCSSARPTMRVFPPQHYGESYTTRLEPALLTSAIQA